MTLKQETLCDGCGKPIPTTAMAYEGYLLLCELPRQHWGGATQGIVPDDPEEDRHFCDKRCLKAYVKASR